MQKVMEAVSLLSFFLSVERGKGDQLRSAESLLLACSSYSSLFPLKTVFQPDFKRKSPIISELLRPTHSSYPTDFGIHLFSVVRDRS